MINVLKANGATEAFSDEKVMNSIRRARIPKNLQPQVLEQVRSKIYDGISTEEIYRHIMEFLETTPQPYIESRYSLKQAIMNLGPSGYPFEDFLAKVLQSSGHETKIRQILSGKCVTHEVDVVATKAGKTAIVEAKFHNSPGTRSEVQTALYTYARFLDVKERNKCDETWLITNTKTTVDANTYAECVGMKVISWDYPEKGSLRSLIEESRLHPITMMKSLSQSAKVALLDQHIVLCKEIVEDESILAMVPLTKEEREKVLIEAKIICSEE